jgi:HKD family nuclease
MLFLGPYSVREKDRHPLALTANSYEFDRIRVAVAFATESGVTRLGDILSSSGFGGADKEWLVGLENGFTQPGALRQLLGLPKSSLCLVDVHEILSNRALATPHFFHPKIYEFAANPKDEVTVVSTSANLTEGGLHTNVEQFLVWKGASSDGVAVTLDTWWRGLWKTEWVADEELIARYERHRPTIQRPSRIIARRAEPMVEIEPAASELRVAPEMWIEAVRPLEGGSRNQLELMLNAHCFFFPDVVDPPRDAPRSLVFEDEAGNVYANPDRQVLFNGPPLRTKGNFMWRVYLPTQYEGLSGYQGGGVFIRFIRSDEPNRYRIAFVPSNSPDADDWYDSSSKVASVSGPPMRLMGWNL